MRRPYVEVVTFDAGEQRLTTSVATGAGASRTKSGEVVRLVLVAAAYFLVIKIGARMFTDADGATAMYPSAGFLLGWLILSNRRDWPLIGAIAAVANGLASPSLISAPTIAAGHSLGEIGATFACAIILGAERGDRDNERGMVARLMRFALATVFVSSPIFALVSAWLQPAGRPGSAALVDGAAYMLGVLVVAPLFTTSEDAAEWLRRSAWRARGELIVVLGVVGAMAYAAYLAPVVDQELRRPVNILLVLPLLWAGMRIGTFAAAWSAALAGVVIEYSTSHGVGLYAILPGTEARHLLFAATYVSIVAILALTNAVVVTSMRRALMRLESTERWFSQLANASPLAMLVVEPDQSTMFFNKALTDLYGYKADQIRTVESFWRHTIPDPDERNMVLHEWFARVEESRRTGTAVRPLESRGIAADGTHRYVEAHGSEIGGRRLILLVDRTADREAKAARRLGEQQFRQLVDSAPIPIMVIEADDDTMMVNRTFTELLGYNAAEMPTVTAYLERVFPDPAYRKRMYAAWQTRLAEWRESGGAFKPLTAQFTCRDGTTRYLEVRTSRVGDRRINTLMDLTERQRADAALRASEAQFRAMFDSSALAISLVDLSGRPMKTNRALSQLLGYTEKELCEKSWMSVTHPEDIESDVVLFNELIAGQRDTYQVEKRYIRKDRGVVNVRVTLSLIRQSNGDPTFYVSMVEDITTRTQLEDALRQAQKMEAVGQLTSGISHDFNNLLSIIIGNVELVTAQLGKNAAPVERELADASEAAHRGAEMIRKLLGFSRQAELRKEPVNLSAVVSGFVRMLRRLLPSDIEVSITLDQSADALTVRADVGAVEQIIVNLATNARDAMPHGGRIVIGVSRGEITDEQRATRPWLTDGSYVALSVTDSGTGMDAATLAMVFEPFFTTKGEGKGTGLGMSMIDGLAKQHEGFVDVQSVIGTGTTVRVWFPVVTASAWAYEAQSVDTSGIRGGTETILLAEDKEALRRVTKRLLEGLGYWVIPAADGAEALNLYNRNRDRIDLVITDMVMPKMHGHELYRAVRDTESTVPFLFASGYSPAELRSRAALGEDVKHLPKPVSLETLAKAIREALNPIPRRQPDESLRESAPDR